MGYTEYGQKHKPLLCIEQQIDHLKAKGVTFDICTEQDAFGLLTDQTYYFKLASYRILFDKRIGGKDSGQYIDLDFGHLKALASLDRNLRYALLPLTLDVEHAARTKLIRHAASRRDEDGYAICADYIASINHKERNRRQGEIISLAHDAYCADLVKHYGTDPAMMPIWVLLELISFGGLTDLYLFCANRWEDALMRDEHYMLKQAKAVRNACAHSSNIMNGISCSASIIKSNNSVERAVAECGFSHRVRTSKMRNPRTKQIVTLLYLHMQMIPFGNSRKKAQELLGNLKNDMRATASIMPKNDTVQSWVEFMATLVESWF